MSRTLTAMFDNRADADAAKARLVASHVDTDHIKIHAQDANAQDANAQGAGDGHGFWHSLKEMFVSDDDRHAYGEGIRRGGFLLTADVDQDEADAAIRILNETNSVDLDQRSADWRGSGWTGRFDEGDTQRTTAGTTEEVIPVIEEELRVGKREVERGGARVRSYIREIPVNEQVQLREEHVSVERRPVDRALGAGEVAGDAFRERSIEMTETSEEAVIGKEARVVEEVVVRKTADTRTENVSDTVRRTEVEVDQDPVQKFAGVSGSGAAGMGGTTNTGSAASIDRDNRVATGIDGTAPRIDQDFATDTTRR